MTVITYGTYDLFHISRLLKRAVAISTDWFNEESL